MKVVTVLAPQQMISMKLEELRDQRRKLNKKIKELEELKEKKEQLDRRISELQLHADDLQLVELKVSRHAIERFKERVASVDDERARSILLNDGTKLRYLTLGDGKYPLKVGSVVDIVVEKGTIVTVISRGFKHSPGPETKLAILRKWVDYYVESRISNYNGQGSGEPMGFNDYLLKEYNPAI